MSFNFNDLIRREIYSMGLDGYNFEVDSEQAFLKQDEIKENTIYVLTRFLQNDNSIGVDTQPVQILILAEQNSLDVAKDFFSRFAKRWNFSTFSTTYDDNGTTRYIWVKQQYSDPVVISNFNTLKFGYRSVLYMNANLYIMNNVVDLANSKVTIDGTDYQALSFSLAYTMTSDTQQKADEFIASSVKSVSTLGIAITIPVIESSLINKILSIVKEIDTTTTDLSDALSYGGNENFYISFNLGQTEFSNLKMKLVSFNFDTSINNIPGIRVGFSK